MKVFIVALGIVGFVLLGATHQRGVSMEKMMLVDVGQVARLRSEMLRVILAQRARIADLEETYEDELIPCLTFEPLPEGIRASLAREAAEAARIVDEWKAGNDENCESQAE